MEIFTLEHFYDFLREEHGSEYVEILQNLIHEHVSRETKILTENIDTYQEGFEDALSVIMAYEEKYPKIPYDDTYIKKTDELGDAIYMYGRNDYSAKVGD